MKTTFLAAALLVSTAHAASGLDFGAWCSDIARFSADRCIEASPDDKAAYDSYLQAITLYDNERIRNKDANRIEAERVNRMGDVTPDQNPTEGAASPR